MPDENDPLAGDLIRAVERLSEVFAGRSIRYAILGGLATLLRGLTNSVKSADSGVRYAAGGH